MTNTGVNKDLNIRVKQPIEYEYERMQALVDSQENAYKIISTYNIGNLYIEEIVVSKINRQQSHKNEVRVSYSMNNSKFISSCMSGEIFNEYNDILRLVLAKYNERIENIYKTQESQRKRIKKLSRNTQMDVLKEEQMRTAIFQVKSIIQNLMIGKNSRRQLMIIKIISGEIMKMNRHIQPIWVEAQKEILESRVS